MTPQRIGCFVLVTLFNLSPSQAHRLSVFAYPEGDRIQVESFFNRGSNCMGCLVEVRNSKGEVVASGTTTEEGKWSFVPSESEGLSLSVTASEGHRAEYTLTDTDYPDTLAASPVTSKATRPESAPSPSPPGDGSVSAEETTAPLAAEEMEAIVDRVMERKLAPIREDLKRLLVKEPGLQEIMSGIGYLFGLCGVAMYFLSRRKGS